MKYLVRMQRRPVFHILDGHDTLCELRATDSIDLTNYQKTDKKPDDVPLCMKCRKRDKKRRSADRLGNIHSQGEPATSLPELQRREAEAYENLIGARKAERRTFDNYIAAKQAVSATR